MPFPAPYLDLAHGFFLSSEDEVCPITALVDEHGEFTSDPTHAVAFEAKGPDCFIVGRVENFPVPTMH